MTAFRVLTALMMGTTLLGGTAPASAQTASDSTQQLRADLDRLRSDFEQIKRDYGQRISMLEAMLAAGAAIRPATPPQTDAGAAVAPPDTSRPPASPEPAGVPTTAAPSGGTPPGAPEFEPPATPPAQTAQVPPGAEGAGGPSGALPVYGSAVTGSKVFNPDMAVIGNALGALGSNRVNPVPALALREAEASFQAIVDPYARADFFVGFSNEGASLEEGYVTFPTLPGGLLVKVGKMKAAFGKVNTLHPHNLPWADRPLVNDTLLGGEEGVNDAGVSVARLIPNPWLFLEATGQVFRGDAGDTLFRSSRRRDVSYVGHLRAYRDLTENGNLDFGASYAGGHNPAGIVDDVDVGRFRTNLFGLDATYRWRPLARSIYRSLIARSEVVWSRRQQFDGVQKALGYYVSADYQFARRWFAGARYDRTDRPDVAALLDTGQSVSLTFRPSEFSQVRGQYRRTSYADGPIANEFLFQFQFSIGAHGAHPF